VVARPARRRPTRVECASNLSAPGAIGAVTVALSCRLTVSMHRILLREVVVDAPSEIFAAERDFWAAALLTRARQVERYPEFTALLDPASLSVVGLQDIGTDGARFHVDLETDDVEAEVARLVRLGAVKVSDGRTWTVLRDPRRATRLCGARRVPRLRGAIPRGVLTDADQPAAWPTSRTRPCTRRRRSRRTDGMAGVIG
jgi:hypothetical protein